MYIAGAFDTTECARLGGSGITYSDIASLILTAIFRGNRCCEMKHPASIVVGFKPICKHRIIGRQGA